MSSSGSSDEGEIRDGDLRKANTTLPQYDGASVDRRDRHRSRSPVNGHQRNTASDRAYQSSYPNRGQRGSKRMYADDLEDRSRRDSRHSRPYYDESSSHRRYSRHYDDPLGDRYSPVNYDDREVANKRRRIRSRSPYRASRDDFHRSGHSRSDIQHSYDDRRPVRGLGILEQGSRHQSVSNRVYDPLPTDDMKHKAKSDKGTSLQHNGSMMPEQGTRSAVTFEMKVEAAAHETPIDEDALIEERRKRREAIKAKYRGAATPLLVQALHLGETNSSISSAKIEDDAQSPRSASPASTPATPSELPTASPAAFAFATDQDLVNPIAHAGDEEDGPSAADYDPTMDMQEDKKRDDQRHAEDGAAVNPNSVIQSTEQPSIPNKSAERDATATKPDEFDMFADVDDMFAEDIITDIEATNPHETAIAKATIVPIVKELDIGMLDNWDDAEGYYKVILGELLNGRYHVQANLGRGMFSGVVRAVDKQTQALVAIKLIRNNEIMRKAGVKEIEILQKINQADPDDKKHMIRLERTFEHKGHLCMVFENLSINLREVLKKFGRDIGINLRAVRAYAQQIFLGLSLMRKCNILHADLKPDNILVNENRNMLKICDLGSASDAAENELTPYLVSRFYRAPEIILGMPYSFAIDVWSVGCTLYELYTGKILFTGRTNNQMLRSIMECRGKFTTKMLKKAQFAHLHFDELVNFRSVEQDKITHKDVVKILNFSTPIRDLRTRLMTASKSLSGPESKELALFVDLLDKCLILNPEKRFTPMDALKHPFILRTGR